MQSSFGIASFRSRTQVLRLEDALRRAGLSLSLIHISEPTRPY